METVRKKDWNKGKESPTKKVNLGEKDSFGIDKVVFSRGEM